MLKKLMSLSGVILLASALIIGLYPTIKTGYASDSTEYSEMSFWKFMLPLGGARLHVNHPIGDGSRKNGELKGLEKKGVEEPSMDATDSTEPMITSEFRYTIVDTNQTTSYDEMGFTMSTKPGDELYGQDANYSGFQPSYQDNGDGTVTDLNTGLMWQKDPGYKTTWSEAVSESINFRLGGYDDWRMPTIKELYSLIQFSGIDPSPKSTDTSRLISFIDTDYFEFEYGNTDYGERIIDSQFASITKYVSTTMRGDETIFGVNFADGRIKGYGLSDPRTKEDKEFFVLYVRGNTDYGQNDYIDNGDGTVTDLATGLMWMKNDSGEINSDGGAMDWPTAIQWTEELKCSDYSDWRMPNAKELQSIVDYTRSPATTNSPAIDPVFNVTPIVDESGDVNYPFYWTSTTHYNEHQGGANAVYVAFGEALGFMKDKRTNSYNLLDVHGAGAQRSDPKIGDSSAFEYGHGPQGDVVRIENYVRAVRTVDDVE